MFPEPGAAQRPVCALRLDGCEVSPGAAAGSPQNLRIRIAQRGRELALLQAHSDEEREAWLKTLQARGGGLEPKKGDGPPPRPPRPSSRPAAGGLLLRRVPTPNTYMDDPFGQPPPAETPKQLYSNAERLQQLVTSAAALCPPLETLSVGGSTLTVPSPSGLTTRLSTGISRPSSAAAEPGPGSARAAPEAGVSPALLRPRPGPCPAPAARATGSSPGPACQRPAAKGQRQAPERGLLRVPAHPDTAREEGAVGWAREKSFSQAGGEGGTAGEGMPWEGQDESRLRDELAGPREVTQGPHHLQLGRLRGIVPQAAAEAQHVSEERPEAAPVPAHGGERKCDEEDKGVGDEIRDVSTERESPREHRAARGSCRTSLESAWNLTFIHHYQCYNYAHLFLYPDISIHTYQLSSRGLSPLHTHPSQQLIFGVQNSRVIQELLALSQIHQQFPNPPPRTPICRDGCG
ncbi:atherin-like isoform X2 [Parus major]|uniref:atherin-like isoform X2 n=1 Tax=Parus major TaxID=9157 RepID=UPI00077132CA|nr:atherin-like isoform X2 [Parus major]